VDQKRPAAPLTKKSDRFLWFALIVLGCVSVYSVSFAVGLLIPRWNHLATPHQQATYHPPKAPVDEPDATHAARDFAAARPQQNLLRDAQPNPANGAGVQGQGANATSTISSFAPTLPATPSQEADLNPPKDTGSQDAPAILSRPALQSPEGNQDTASSVSRNAVSRDHDDNGPATTSGLASIPSASPSARNATRNAGLGPSSTPSQSPNASAPSATSPRGTQTTQNSPPQSPSPAMPAKRHAPSEFSQKVWYK
jgi:hypothetical protein